MVYSREVIDQTLALASAGMSDYEISRRTGISRGAVLKWRHGRLPARARPSEPACVACAAPEHDFTALAGPAYAYLLGQYLGDGTVRRNRSSYALEIASDALYPGIIEECRNAIVNVSGRPPRVALLRHKRMARIVSYWKSWPCLLPQHGQGRKHSRTIALAPLAGDDRGGPSGPVRSRAHPFRRMARTQSGSGQGPPLRVSALPVVQPIGRHPHTLHLRVRAARR